jgi:hypothetical protein
MENIAETLFGAIVVGFLWGGTNPLLERGATPRLQEMEKKTKHTKSFWRRVFAPLSSLASPAALLPYCLNQAGSVAFYLLLSQKDLRIVLPL